MSKKNRERRLTDSAPEAVGGGGGGGVAWLPVVLAAGALVIGFVAWTDGKNYKAEMTKRMVDLDTKINSLQVQVANAAKQRPAQQGPDPNKVYTIKTEGAPAEGNATAPIVIAEFSDYQ